MKPLEQTEHLMVIRDGSGRTILTFDVTGEGVKLDYDQKDLPAIQEAVAKVKGKPA